MAGGSCQPSNPCKSGTYSCATGTRQCVEGGNKASGTTCGGSQACSNATETTADTCNGSGQCQTGETRSCGVYVCGGNQCRTNCDTATHCASGYYCGSGKKCVEQKQNGALCANNDECSSFVCGGRCCPVNMPCSCTQPSAGNLLVNEGFDTGMSNWSDDPSGTAEVWTGTYDAESCAYSGSVGITVSASDISRGSGQIAECVIERLARGIQLRRTDHDQPEETPDLLSQCTLKFFTTTNCTGSSIATATVDPLAPDPPLTYNWYAFGDSLTAPAGTRSGSLECFFFNDDSSLVDLWLDMLYLSPAPTKF